MYIESVNVFSEDKGIICNNPIIMCNDEPDVMDKTVDINFDFKLNANCFITFNVCFVNGCSSSTEPLSKMTINGKKVYSNRFGTLTELDYHKITEYDSNQDPVEMYVVMQANTTLEFYYDETLDNNNGGFVIVGNPKIFSSFYNNIYADGSKGTTIKRIKKGDTTVVNTNYPLNPGEKFSDWDFIVPISDMYEDGVINYYGVNAIIPIQEIEYCINSISNINTQRSFFLLVGGKPSVDRRICWGPISDTEYSIGHRDGTSGHLPHFYGFYGIKMGSH